MTRPGIQNSGHTWLSPSLLRGPLFYVAGQLFMTYRGRSQFSEGLVCCYSFPASLPLNLGEAG